MKVDNSTEFILKKDSQNRLVTDVKYTQVWESKFDFVENLSIIDLLFCKGLESVITLNQMNKIINV